MAQRVLLVCDLHDDDRTGAETIAFTFDGASYEIDLCTDHANAFRDAMASYVGAARRGGGGSSGGGGSTSPRRSRIQRGANPDRQRTQEIREWARAQGHQVSDRGRIPARLFELYEAAH